MENKHDISGFLDNLKKAVDTGEFNSEAAKKINEIHELADTKTDLGEVGDNIRKRAESDKKHIQPVDEKDVQVGNLEYEKKMAKFKEMDLINSETATLDEIDFLVKSSIVDMFDHIESLEKKYSEKLKTDEYKLLLDKITEIKEKYI